MKRNLLFILFFLIIGFGCKKSEEDESAPSIQIFSPIINQQYNVGDTIFVSATVKDDMVLDVIKVSLYDYNKNSEMVHFLVFKDNGKEKKIDCYMILDNATIESGIYYLAVSASDGTNSKNYFVPIFVNGLTRKLLGFIYVSIPMNNTIDVRRIDTLENDSLIIGLEGDFSASELNSKYQKIFVAGAQTGNLYAVDLSNNTISWSVVNQSNNGLPWFYQLYFSNNLLYVSTQDGLISGYSINGMRSKVYTLPVSWHGVEFIDAERRFIAQVENVSVANHQLAQFYNSSASFITQQAIPFDIVKLCPYNTEKIMVFANLNGGGTIYEFDFLLHSFNTLTEISNQEIIDVVQISKEQYLILTTQQIYLYNHGQSIGLASLNFVADGKQVLYDENTNCYFVVKSQQIDQHSLPNGSFVNSIMVSKPISKAHLYYNR